MKTAIKELSKIYDDLYEQGQKIIDTFNPCEISNDKCARVVDSRFGLSQPFGYFCCQGCKYLGETGCTTKSLWCKLWLCYSRTEKHKECSKQLDRIHLLSHILGFFDGRRSKEQTLTGMRRLKVESIRKNIDKYRSMCAKVS